MCATCAISFTGDPKYNGLLQDDDVGLVFINFAGCVAATTGDVTDMGCGAKMQAVNDCGKAACEGGCDLPVTDQSSFDEYTTCLDDAEGEVCKTYVDAANACLMTALAAGGAVLECPNQGGMETFDEWAHRYVNLFCGAAGGGGAGGGGGGGVGGGGGAGGAGGGGVGGGGGAGGA
jgi:hypothetical protein